MGIDMQGFARDEGSDELPPGVNKENIVGGSSSSPPRPPPQAASRQSPPPPPPQAKVEEVEPEADDGDDDAQAKKAALAEKQKGTDAYKARRFDDAQTAFSKAWDLWPKDITFLTNLAGELMFRHLSSLPVFDSYRAPQPPTLRRAIMIRASRHAKRLSKRAARSARTTRLSPKPWAASAARTNAKATLQMQSNSTKSRSRSTGRQMFSPSCARFRRRSSIRTRTRTSTQSSATRHGTKAMRSSRRVNLPKR